MGSNHPAPNRGLHLRALPLALALLLAVAAAAVAAESPDGQAKRPKDEKIKVAADAFLANTRENYAEFTGNVNAVQGAFEIMSERLRIYYRSDTDPREPLALKNAEIREIVATGNVRILADGRKAQADRAVYTIDNQELVLSGPDATLSSEENRISGSKITFNRITRQVKIEGKGQRRVSGTFYTSKQLTDKDRDRPPDVVFLTPPPSRRVPPPEILVVAADQGPETSAPVAQHDSAVAEPLTETETLVIADQQSPIEEDTPQLGTIATGPTETIEEGVDQGPEPATPVAQGDPEVAEAPVETETLVIADQQPPIEENAPELETIATGPTKTIEEVVDQGPEPATPVAQGDPAATEAQIESETLVMADRQPPVDAGNPQPEIVVSESAAVMSDPEEGASGAGQSLQSPSEPAPPPVLASVQEEPLVVSPPETRVAPASPVVPLQSLTKRVAIAAFGNTTPFQGKGLELTLQGHLTAAIEQEAPQVELLRPDNPDYPAVFTDLPRQASGRLNNQILIQAGRRLGLNAIVTGSLVDIKVMTEPTGFWRFKGTRVVARITAAVGVYDTATGAKLLDELLVRKIEMDEADLYAAPKGRLPDIAGLQETVIDMAQEAGETVAEKIDRQSWRGFITEIDGDRVIMSPGASAGLVAGNQLVIYDETPVSGNTGHLYFLPGRKIGEIQVTAVDPNRAEAVIVSGSSIREGLPVVDPETNWTGKTGWRERLAFW